MVLSLSPCSNIHVNVLCPVACPRPRKSSGKGNWKEIQMMDVLPVTDLKAGRRTRTEGEIYIYDFLFRKLGFVHTVHCLLHLSPR